MNPLRQHLHRRNVLRFAFGALATPTIKGAATGVDGKPSLPASPSSGRQEPTPSPEDRREILAKPQIFDAGRLITGSLRRRHTAEGAKVRITAFDSEWGDGWIDLPVDSNSNQINWDSLQKEALAQSKSHEFSFFKFAAINHPLLDTPLSVGFFCRARKSAPETTSAHFFSICLDESLLQNGLQLDGSTLQTESNAHALTYVREALFRHIFFSLLEDERGLDNTRRQPDSAVNVEQARLGSRTLTFTAVAGIPHGMWSLSSNSGEAITAGAVFLGQGMSITMKESEGPTPLEMAGSAIAMNELRSFEPDALTSSFQEKVVGPLGSGSALVSWRASAIPTEVVQRGRLLRNGATTFVAASGISVSVDIVAEQMRNLRAGIV